MMKKKKGYKKKKSNGDLFGLAINSNSRKTKFFLGYDAPKTKLKRTSKLNKGDFSLSLKNTPMRLRGSKKARGMNWKQAKKAYPGLKPFGDADFDGILNNRDCKPFDPTRHGKLSRALGKLTGDRFGQTAEQFKREREGKKIIKAIKIREAPRIQRAKRERPIPVTLKKTGKVIKQFRAPGAYKRTSQGSSIAGVTLGRPKTGGTGKRGRGRPRASYKYRDPITGKPVPYTEYRRVTRQLKSRRRTIAELKQAEQRTRLARKGIPPGVTAQLQQARNQQLKQAAQQVLTPEEEMSTAQEMLTRGASNATPEQLQQQAITAQQLSQLPIQQQPTTPQGLTLTTERLRKIAELRRRGFQVLPDGTVLRPKTTSNLENVQNAIGKVTNMFNGLRRPEPKTKETPPQ